VDSHQRAQRSAEQRCKRAQETVALPKGSAK